MARPRTPKAKAKVTGQDVQHAPRFNKRQEPTIKESIGEPPGHLKEWPRKAWAEFQKEVPWLNSSHRLVIEIASNIRGLLMSGEEVGVQKLNLLRQILGQLGATPADASKVTIPDGEGEKDPADKYFK